MANLTPKSDRDNHENLDAALAEKFAEIKQDIEDLNERERAATVLIISLIFCVDATYQPFLYTRY